MCIAYTFDCVDSTIPMAVTMMMMMIVVMVVNGVGGNDYDDHIIRLGFDVVV